MATKMRAKRQEPLTFHNAPTIERNGATYLEHDAGLELARRLAARDAELLARLAEE